MFAQFALVIAATALLSAICAATLSPTQCALLLRRPVPPEQRNIFFRAFNRVYDGLENGYSGLVGAMVRVSGIMVVVALIFGAVGAWGIARLPTALHPERGPGLRAHRRVVA
jgi:HAE1 family hydrophobic/amphiphilic exporter-1